MLPWKKLPEPVVFEMPVGSVQEEREDSGSAENEEIVLTRIPESVRADEDRTGAVLRPSPSGPSPSNEDRTAQDEELVQRSQYNDVFDKLRWAGLDLADPHGEEKHLGETLRGAKLVGYSKKTWASMQELLEEVFGRSRKRVAEGKAMQEWNIWSGGAADNTAAGDGEHEHVEWDSHLWTHEFLADLNFKMYDSAAILYDLDKNEIKSVFLPLSGRSLEEGEGGGAAGAEAEQEGAEGLLDAAETYAQLGYPKARGCNDLLSMGRGKKFAEGGMWMCGTHVVHPRTAAITKRNEDGKGQEAYSIDYFGKNNPKREGVEKGVAEFAARFAEFERKVVPKGATTVNGCFFPPVEGLG